LDEAPTDDVELLSDDRLDRRIIRERNVVHGDRFAGMVDEVLDVRVEPGAQLVGQGAVFVGFGAGQQPVAGALEDPDVEVAFGGKVLVYKAAGDPARSAISSISTSS
ncbi:MAG TPA: hypothetical protein VMU34_12030, partial [Mycobacterium sp.]|nr:hypothetical protein [Mycobacterium sp.]